MYEVLGLFILFIVGVMLIGEGGHLAHLSFFGHPVEPMAERTFYFVAAPATKKEQRSELRVLQSYV